MYLLVKCGDNVGANDDRNTYEIDPVILCKRIEELAGVEVCAIVRSNADKYDDDYYIMAANTTLQAKRRLDAETEDENYGYVNAD